MSLGHFIDKQRLNNVLLKMQKHYPNFTKGELLGALDKKFFEMFFSGQFGSDMMITAGYKFLTMVEDKLGKEAAAIEG